MSHPLDIFKFCPKCGSDKFRIKSNIAKKCDVCGFEWYKNPIIGVAPLIFDNLGRLLIVRRAKNPGKGKLGFPGGFADLHETAEEALARETKEEVNLDIIIKKYFCSLPNSYIYSGYEAHPMDFFFICEVTDSSMLKVDVEEVEDAFFLPLNEINADDLAFESNKIALERLKKQTLNK